MMLKLSILMNSYNRHDIIRDAIESIIGSDIPKDLELELVIVDDHSNDKTWNVLDRYSGDPRFIIHRNESNVGSGARNWNTSFGLATGDLIMVTADDMIWDPNCIRLLYNELMKHDMYTCVLGIYINTDSKENLPDPTLKTRDYSVIINPLTGMPSIPTDGSSEHVTRNLSFCYREFYDGLDEFFHPFPVNGIREETDQYMRIMKLKPQRKIVVVDKAVRYHVHNIVGGYRMDNRKYKRWTRKNHRSFLRRNFGWKAACMIPFFHIYLVQKWFRDLIGKNVIEKMK